MSHQQLLTINGLVIPSSWDKSGNIAGLTIAAFDESEYHVKSCAGFQKLMTMLHKEIEAVGWVFCQGKSNFIDVVRFREKKDSAFNFLKNEHKTRRDISHI